MRIWRQYKNKIVPVSSFDEVKKFCEHYDEIEVDTETFGFDAHTVDLLCVQLGTPEIQYLIEWKEELIPFLKTLFLRKDKQFLLQNAKFDLQFFYKHGILFENNIYDTFLAESIIYCGMDYKKKGLDALADRYLGIDVSKEVRSDIPFLGLVPKVIEYALNDVKYLTPIKAKQEKIIKTRHMENALKLDNSFVRVLAYIEYCGIAFDADAWLVKAANDRVRLTDVEKELNEAVIKLGDTKFMDYGDLFAGEEYRCKINWNSEKQVIPLFEHLGLDLWTEDKGKVKKSIGVKVITPQANLHEIIPIYLKYAKYQKRCSTFGEDYLKFIHPITGRIHTTYKQIVNTGRMSCGNSKQTPPKPNLQQVPADKEHRECFIAAPGCVLIASDYSGQEAVVFANKCLDENLLAFYDAGLGDMHSYVAKLCFPDDLNSIELDDVKKERPDLRQKAKAAGFAIQFGGNGYTISKNLSLTPAEGDAVYTAYMFAFPQMKDYFDMISEEVLGKGYIVFNEVTGRRSIIDYFHEYQELQHEMDEFDWTQYREEKACDSDLFKNVLKPKVQAYFRKKGDITRKSYNYPVQGTAADITKTAACLIFNRILRENWFGIVKFVHVVHDEIIMECPEDMADEVAAIVKTAMENAGAMFYTRVPLTATPLVAKVWEH